MNINVNAELVDINSIQPHPQNPRLGDVVAIADSLHHHGQYVPIVVWNDTIIAGNHTWKAMKSLGEKKIAITRYEGTEEDALRILIADNRASDLASYDNSLLLELLKSIPDLEGTGYSTEEVDALDGLFSNTKDGVGGKKEQPDEGPDDDVGESPVVIRLGEWQGILDSTVYGIWLESVKDAIGSEKKPVVVRELRARLDFPETAKESRPQKGHRASSAAPERHAVVSVSMEPLETLKRYPGNPREGDIGAISEMLATLGQYRPLVVNSRTREILKGNHTAAAMASLGWKDAAVVFVDVDEIEAAKIVIVDNRTSDMGTYDNDMLKSGMEKLPSLDGTGFDVEDLLRLQLGDTADTPKPVKTGKEKFAVGEYSWAIPSDCYQQWKTEMDYPQEAITRLGIPSTAVLHGEG